jgi:hypothetical protein
VIERRGTQLAPDAAPLDAAERHLQVDAPARIDRDHAGLDRPHYAERTGEVARPERPREAVDRVVGQPDRLLFGVERQDGGDRSEDLLAGDLRAGVDVAEDRRLVEAAAVPGISGLHFAAAAERRSLQGGAADEAVHPVAVRRGDERTHLGRFGERIAQADRTGALDETVDEFLIDRTLDEDAAPGAAVLPGVAEDGEDGTRGFFEVGVREDEAGGLAAQFQGDAFDVAGCEALDLDADLGRAGEGDLAHVRMAGESRTGGAARAGNDIEHSRRDAGLASQLGQPESGQRRRRCRLDHYGVAEGEGGRDLPGGDREREVPGDDQGADPDRLAEGQAGTRGSDRHGLTAEGGDETGVVLEAGRSHLDLAARLRDRLADVSRFESRQLGSLGADPFGQPKEDPGTFGRARPPPLAELPGPPRRRHRGVDIFRASLGDRGDDLAGRGGEDLRLRPG